MRVDFLLKFQEISQDLGALLPHQGSGPGPRRGLHLRPKL